MQPALLNCPTCGTPASKAALGMRDYSRWLASVLPGKVGMSDVDGMLHQEATGRILAVEFKEANKRLTTGQRLMLRALKRKGVDVWVVWEYSDHVKVGSMDDLGEVVFMEQMSEVALGAKVKAWWWAGL